MKRLDELIERTPFLRLLPQNAIEVLRQHFTEEEFRFGQVIVSEGEPAWSYYLLTSGRARVIKKTEAGQEIPLHVLQAGESFGEIGLLNGGVRTATVRACEDVTVLRLARDDFNQVLRDNPRLRDYIRLQMQNRRLHAFLLQYTKFGDAPVPALEALVASLEPTRFKAGETIIRDGDAAGPMYIVESGHVRISKEQDAQSKDLAFLRAGDFFGEYSFLQGSPRFANATAETDCCLLTLESNSLDRILRDHPGFRKVVEDRVQAYHSRHEAVRPLDFTQASEPAERFEDNDQTRSLRLPSHLLTPGIGLHGAATPLSDIELRQPKKLGRFRRFRFLHQIDEADCGAAALAMVCRYFGRRVSPSYIRELCCTTADGASLNDLCRAAAELGLAARAVRKAGADTDQLPCPAILHWEDMHWVVLLETRPGEVRLADPAQGIRWAPREEVESKWSGYAAIFIRTDAFANAPVERTSWSWILPFLKPFKLPVAAAVVLTFVICALQALVPILTKITIDEVIQLKDVARLNVIVIALGATLGVGLLLTMFQRRILTFAAAGIDGDILNFIMDHMLSLPMSYFINRSSVDIQRRLEGVRKIRRFLVDNSVTGVLAAVQIIVFVGLMCYFNAPMAALFVGIMIPLYGILMFFSAKTLRPAFGNLEENEARFQLLQDEIVNGIEVVKASGSERRFREATVRDFRQVTKGQSQSKLNIFVYEGTVQGVWFLSSILLLWMGALQVMDAANTQFTEGKFIAFYMLMAMAYSPAMTIMNLWEELQSAAVLMARLNDLMEHPAEQEAQKDALAPVTALAGSVTLRNVGFRYGGPDAPQVLRDISLSVTPGQRVAVIGRDGAGKTTLMKCLATLLEPQQGAIQFDGIEATKLSHDQLRRHLGVVLSDNYLFSGAIADNIAFGDPTPSFERIRWAAETVELHEFIAALPQGYQTIVGAAGPLLSRGQQQCLAIARAIYRNPGIYILDEATSNMDAEADRNIHERLLDVLRDHTVFMVTHRLATAREADLILLLEGGRIVEQGGHEELMARRGLYFHLFNRQVE